MIEEITISNFLSIVNASVKLAPLTVLIGPNNAGKSNTLRAIRMLRDSLPHGINFAVTQRENVLAGQLSQGHSYVYGSKPGTRMSIRAKTTSGIINVDGVVARVENVSPDYQFRLDTQLKVFDPTGATPFAVGSDPWKRILAEARTSPIFSLEPQSMKQSVALNFRDEFGLQPNGFGLAGMLFTLQAEHPDVWENLVEEFREFAPEVKRIHFKPETAQVALSYWDKRTNSAMAIGQMSDGIVYLTGLLALRYAKLNCAVLLIEHPEHGIHPRRLQQITDSLRELAYGTDNNGSSERIQVIMTSHSPYFIDRFRDSPESVVIVDNQGTEGTKLTRLSDKLDPKTLKESSLGELWYSGVLGGVPKS